MEKVALVIVAAGKGLRAGGDRPKQFAHGQGRAMLAHTVEVAVSHGRLAPIVVAAPADEPQSAKAALGPLADAVAIIPGGDSRQASVCLGLEHLAREQAPPEAVLIHDGARPGWDGALIERVCNALQPGAAVLPAIAVADTIWQRGTAAQTLEPLDRARLLAAQTPQGFSFAEILAAHRAHRGAAMTDDIALAQATGMPIATVEGAAQNNKITSAEDLRRWQQSLAEAACVLEPRIGSGFDVHAFAESPAQTVRLGGIDIAHDRALSGHSDADVVIHALCDAIYGALADGDIGHHFPPSEAAWRGADSAQFLIHAAERLAHAGGRLINADVTVICERPKIGPHRHAMAARLAALLGVMPGRVAVKATTTEKLGFTGRREGIACQVAVSLLVPAERGAA